jgi:hypothetical protein
MAIILKFPDLRMRRGGPLRLEHVFLRVLTQSTCGHRKLAVLVK